jgi:predicted Zn-dependent protease
MKKRISFYCLFSLAVFLLSCESFSNKLTNKLNTYNDNMNTFGENLDSGMSKLGDNIQKTAAAIKEIKIPEDSFLGAYVKVFENITPEQEYYIGRFVAGNVLSTYKLQTNEPAMTAYINRITNTLVINSPKPEIYNGYHASILDSDEINAFATPGGHIYVTRGLIACTTSEDTLAAVIAHEIAHIQLQHGLKAIKGSRGARAFSDTLSRIPSEGDGKFARGVKAFKGGIDNMVTTMMTKGYSQAQEYSADKYSLGLLAVAGYEPESIVDMLSVLQKEQPAKGGGFNDTHPTPKRRIENINKVIANYSVPDTRSHRETRYAAVIRQRGF